MKLSFKLPFAASVLAVSLSAAAFTSGMTAAQIDSEVQQRLQNNESLSSIAAAANDVGVSASLLTTSLITQGQPATQVVAALVPVFADDNSVVNAAASTPGADRQALVTAAIGAGADPTTITGPTAAGPTNNSNAGQSGNTPSFSSSQSGTPSGGGGGSVSRS